MKVLLVATVQSHIAQFHRPLAEILHEHGYEVHVAAKDNLAEKNGLKLDFVDKVYNIPFSRSPKSTDNIKAYKQLKKILDSEYYDVVHCNTPMGGIVARLAARKTRRHGTKVFYTAHGFHFYKGAPVKNWLVYYPIEKFFSCLTDKLITITQEDYELAKKKFHCEVHRIHGVGVDEKRYFPVNSDVKSKLRKELGYADDETLILCIGELLPNKNQAMAIRVMKNLIKEVPKAKLLLAGNGPEKTKLEGLISELGLENHVEMLGYCTCLEKYQKIVDLGVSCSKREGLPLNVVESMLSCTPIVASKNRGHRELIQNAKTGYLVDINADAQMLERVLNIIKDVELKNCISKGAYKYAVNYGFQRVMKELEAVYCLN